MRKERLGRWVDEFLEEAQAAARELREAGLTATPQRDELPEAKLRGPFTVRGFAPQEA